MKQFKKYEVSIAFWTVFLIVSLGGGALPSEPHANAHFYFFQIFAKSARMLFENFVQIAKISFKL